MYAPLYLAAATLLWMAALPLSLSLLLSKKHRTPALARLFLWRNPPLPSGGIHLHAASFGEVCALGPIVDHLSTRGAIHITVATATGYAEAKKRYPKASVRYLPFECFLPLWLTPQRALIVFDAELWFALFWSARKKGAVTALINARLPDKSWPRYQKRRWFFRPIFAQIDHIWTQSETDTDRFIQLGIRHATTLGNIKLLQTPTLNHTFEKPEGFITTAASTHEGEETLIAQAWIESQIAGRLLVVPRHPDRFEAVAKTLEAIAAEHQKRFDRFSRSDRIDGADIVLIDAMGLLNSIYAISDLVIMAGSFMPKGGHNPLEPAHFGCRIITGEHNDFQRALFAQLGGVVTTSGGQLSRAIAQGPHQKPVQLRQSLTHSDLKEALDGVL